MRISKGVRQIVGQLAQRVVLPDGPMRTLLESLNVDIDIGLGIGKVVTAEPISPSGPLQIGQWIAVRLKRAKQKGQFKSFGVKSILAVEQSGGQKLVAAFFQKGHLPETFKSGHSITSGIRGHKGKLLES